MAWCRPNTLAINTELMWNPNFLEDIKVTPSKVQKKMISVLEKCENYIKESGHPLNFKKGTATVTGYSRYSASSSSSSETHHCYTCGGTYSNTNYDFSDEQGHVLIDCYIIHWIQKHVPAGLGFPSLYDDEEKLAKLDSILNQLLYN